MKMQDVMKVDVELNALCYALWQAEDYIPVVYCEAEYDESVHFKQVQQLARACVKRFQHCDLETVENSHQWDNRILDIAACNTLEEYKKL